MTTSSAPPGASQAAQTTNELILSDDQGGIKYGGRTYIAVLELADGTKQTITDPKALQRIIKILQKANYHNETQDLSQTTITQKAVNLNGKNLLGADSDVIAKVTKTFNKIIGSSSSANNPKSTGSTNEGIHFNEKGKPKADKAPNPTGAQTEKLKEESPKDDVRKLTPEQMKAQKKSQEQEKNAALAKEASEQAKAKQAKVKKEADKKAEDAKTEAAKAKNAKQTDDKPPFPKLTSLTNPAKISQPKLVAFDKARQNIQDGLDVVRKTNGLEKATPTPNKSMGKKLINKTEVKLVKGDLLKENVDVIVNAANKVLGGIGNGGVCEAIFDAGKGPKNEDPMQEECDLFTQNLMPNGSLPIGQAVMTNSGYIKGIKRVIHTPGPDYRIPSERTQLQKLYDCYYNSMKLAADNGFTSIAFPSISTGIFKVPYEDARAMVIKAIEDFAKTDTRLKEVHLVLFKGNVLTGYLESGFFDKP